MAWTFYNASGEALTSFGPVALTDLDIDGGAAIGEAVVGADLFIMDNGAGGTNVKVTATEIATFINTASQVVTAHAFYGSTYNLQSNSVNIASIAKDSTGIGTVTFTANMANVNYGMGIILTSSDVSVNTDNNAVGSFKINSRKTVDQALLDSGARFVVAGPLA